MRIVLFCHSLISDWNHGNAHFLRGIVRALRTRGHDVRVFEPRDAWSRKNLAAEIGDDPEPMFRAAFPGLGSQIYDPGRMDLDVMLDGADLVLVHEWIDPSVVRRLGRHRVGGGRYRLLFHDTHHRSVSARADMAGLDLDGYDGVLAFGEAVRELYLRNGWSRRAWTWHEAADTAIFRPQCGVARDRDLVWVGNWGDDERTAELHEYLITPVRVLGLAAAVHGVRYPDAGRQALADAGIRFEGYLPNHRVPATFARYRVTIHVPRRQYATALPGIPTIRVFEALACGIPLISAPWSDCEGLFRPDDFLRARSGQEMARQLRAVVSDPELAAAVAGNGLTRIRARHTCAHRVDELLAIVAALDGLPKRATGSDAAMAMEAS